MKTELRKIWNKKDDLRKDLIDMEGDMFALIFDRVLNHVDWKKIRAEINKTMLSHMPKELDPKAYTKLICNIAALVNKRAKHEATLMPGLGWGLVVFNEINKQKYANFVAKQRTKLINGFETEEKNKVLKESQNNFEYPFVLVSEHEDSAEDHADYQGKLYVKSGFNDPEIRKIVNKYHMHEWNWVMGGPVYMITRPNCRHYFRDISLEEAQKYTVTELINKYGMHHRVGKRKLYQTPKSRGERTLEIYENRLRMHKKMLKSDPKNQNIKNAISKDQVLISRWKKGNI